MVEQDDFRLMDLPDVELISFLVKQKGFTEVGAEKFVKIFRANMRLTGLDNTSDYVRQTAWNKALRKGT